MTDVDVLSSRMKSRLHLQTKTIGADRIKKAKDNNEDIAVLSMFLPNASAVEENRSFYCSLGDYCRLGDPRATKAGNDGPALAAHKLTMLIKSRDTS